MLVGGSLAGWSLDGRHRLAGIGLNRHPMAPIAVAAALEALLGRTTVRAAAQFADLISQQEIYETFMDGMLQLAGAPWDPRLVQP
jgi:hypothetical protein